METTKPLSDDERSEGRGSQLKVLDKAVSLLELFTVARPEWGVTELSQATDLPVSTVHRIITVLKQHGLIAQDPQSRKYRLGFGAIALGRRAAASLRIRQVAEPVMRRLAREVEETVVLTVVNDTRDRSVCIERIESQYPLRLHLEVGRQVYLHAGASSKVLLAYFSPEEIDALCHRVGLPKLARNTITDPEALKADLAEIRRRGYAFSREETNEGAWGIAVPILDQQGRAIAGLGVAGPTSRHSPEVEERFVELTRKAAAEIAVALGMRAP